MAGNDPAAAMTAAELLQKYTELQNAIASNNYSKAFQIVQYFSKNPKKHSIILTISTLYSFFVKIIQFVTLMYRTC